MHFVSKQRNYADAKEKLLKKQKKVPFHQTAPALRKKERKFFKIILLSVAHALRLFVVKIKIV